MRNFSEIFAVAAARKGGPRALEKILSESHSASPEQISAIPDDRVLAEMTKWIFYAGFSSKVIDNKWEAFEAAFWNFNLHRCAYMTEDSFSQLMNNRGIVRNGAKIRSVQVNAQLLLSLAAEHRGAARYFAEWPDSDFAELLDLLKKRGNHLAGVAAMRFLRALGKPAFVTSPAMIAALLREGVLSRPPGGKRDLATIQEAFNTWEAQSGRDLTAISRVLAMSIEGGYYGPSKKVVSAQ